jgi:hypothetical protein
VDYGWCRIHIETSRRSLGTAPSLVEELLHGEDMVVWTIVVYGRRDNVETLRPGPKYLVSLSLCWLIWDGVEQGDKRLRWISKLFLCI